MCGLCGSLGGSADWAEAGADVFKASTPRRGERQARARLANRVLALYGLKLEDWGGASYVLRNRTGGTQIIDNLTQMWPAAEVLARRPCDPLDPDIVDAVERLASASG